MVSGSVLDCDALDGIIASSAQAPGKVGTSFRGLDSRWCQVRFDFLDLQKFLGAGLGLGFLALESATGFSLKPKSTAP